MSEVRVEALDRLGHLRSAISTSLVAANGISYGLPVDKHRLATTGVFRQDLRAQFVGPFVDRRSGVVPGEGFEQEKLLTFVQQQFDIKSPAYEQGAHADQDFAICSSPRLIKPSRRKLITPRAAANRDQNDINVAHLHVSSSTAKSTGQPPAPPATTTPEARRRPFRTVHTSHGRRPLLGRAPVASPRPKTANISLVVDTKSTTKENVYENQNSAQTSPPGGVLRRSNTSGSMRVKGRLEQRARTSIANDQTTQIDKLKIECRPKTSSYQRNTTPLEQQQPGLQRKSWPDNRATQAAVQQYQKGNIALAKQSNFRDVKRHNISSIPSAHDLGPEAEGWLITKSRSVMEGRKRAIAQQLRAVNGEQDTSHEPSTLVSPSPAMTRSKTTLATPPRTPSACDQTNRAGVRREATTLGVSTPLTRTAVYENFLRMKSSAARCPELPVELRSADRRGFLTENKQKQIWTWLHIGEAVTEGEYLTSIAN